MVQLSQSIKMNRPTNSVPMSIIIITEAQMEETHGQTLIFTKGIALQILPTSARSLIPTTTTIRATRTMQAQRAVSFSDGRILKLWRRELITPVVQDFLREFLL